MVREIRIKLASTVTGVQAIKRGSREHGSMKTIHFVEINTGFVTEQFY